MKYPDRGATKIVSLPLTTLVDEVDSSTTYVGEAQIGTATSVAEWRIKKISTSSTITTIAYAQGDSNFNSEWDERTNYSYS